MAIWYPAWWTNSLQWKLAIEIVDFPIKTGDFPWQNVSSPEGKDTKNDGTSPSFMAAKSLNFMGNFQ